MKLPRREKHAMDHKALNPPKDAQDYQDTTIQFDLIRQNACSK